MLIYVVAFVSGAQVYFVYQLFHFFIFCLSSLLCRRIKKNSFQKWVDFVREEKEERIREKRRDELRRKVQGWLPDFNASGKT